MSAEKKTQERQQRKLRRRARRDVRAAYRPELAAIERQKEQAQTQAGQYEAQIAQLYSGLGGQLSSLQPAYAQQMTGIQEGYQSGLEGLIGLLGTTAPAGELAASAGLLGNIGAGGLELLASQGARNAAYGTSAQRQSAIDSTSYQSNIMQALQNALDDLSGQREDIYSGMPEQILSRLDELRDTAKQYGLASKEYQLRKAATEAQIGNDNALAKWVEEQTQNAPNQRRRRNNTPENSTGSGGTQDQSTQAPGPYGGAAGLLKRFTSGQVSWADLAKPKRKRIRANIATYLPRKAPGAMPSGYGPWSPQELIDYIRQHVTAGSPGTYGASPTGG